MSLTIKTPAKVKYYIIFLYRISLLKSYLQTVLYSNLKTSYKTAIEILIPVW